MVPGRRISDSGRALSITPEQLPGLAACELILGDPTAPSNIIQIPIDSGNIQARDCPGNNL